MIINQNSNNNFFNSIKILFIFSVTYFFFLICKYFFYINLSSNNLININIRFLLIFFCFLMLFFISITTFKYLEKIEKNNNKKINVIKFIKKRFAKCFLEKNSCFFYIYKFIFFFWDFWSLYKKQDAFMLFYDYLNFERFLSNNHLIILNENNENIENINDITNIHIKIYHSFKNTKRYKKFLSSLIKKKTFKSFNDSIKFDYSYNNIKLNQLIFQITFISIIIKMFFIFFCYLNIFNGILPNLMFDF